MENNPVNQERTPQSEITKSEQIKLPTNMSKSSLLLKLQSEKRAAVNYQARRHGQWNDNYTLYRDTPEMNRLTQREPINIPLTKETVKTLLSRINEDPTLTFTDRGGDEEKEMVVTEKWAEDFNDNRLELQDAIEKKQVLLYGRTHTKHNFVDGEWVAEVKDIYDIVVDPKTKPLDLETARYLVELHIYRPLMEVINDDRYDQEARNLMQQERVSNQETGGTPDARSIGYAADARARNERMEAVGALPSELEAVGYDHITELNQHFTNIWDAELKKYERYIVLVADEKYILRAEKLIDALGIEQWPMDTWADDIEATDYWTDGVVDSIRKLNQVLNVWISQMTENRTLRNFGMNFYDSTAVEGFTPTGYDPQPGAWYPLPGKPADVYQRVDVGDLGSIVDDIQFLVAIAEKASATGAIDKGVVEQGKRTLGEIEIAVAKSMERTTSMTKFYRRAWKDRAQMWYDILEANREETLTLYKKNRNGKYVGSTFKREQWVSNEGYIINVESFAESMAAKTDELQRLQAIKQMYPENPELDKAIQRRALGIVDLTPEEKKAVMDYEKNKAKQNMAAQGAGAQGMGNEDPLAGMLTAAGVGHLGVGPAPAPVDMADVSAKGSKVKRTPVAARV